MASIAIKNARLWRLHSEINDVNNFNIGKELVEEDNFIKKSIIKYFELKEKYKLIITEPNTQWIKKQKLFIEEFELRHPNTLKNTIIFKEKQAKYQIILKKEVLIIDKTNGNDNKLTYNPVFDKLNG